MASILIAVVLALAIGLWVGLWVGRYLEKRTSEQVVATMNSRLARGSRELSAAQKAYERVMHMLVQSPGLINRMSEASSLNELSRIAVRTMMDVAGAGRVGLFLPDQTGLTFRIEVLAGMQPTKPLVFQLGQGRLGTLAQKVGVHAPNPGFGSPDHYVDQVFAPELAVSLRRFETTFAFVAMDQVASRDTITKRVIQMIADVYVVSAEKLRKLDQERAKADHDQLTGLLNRRHLDWRLPEELERARLQERPLSVFLFDIDNFKHYNDTNGHQAGDDCLKLVASVAKQVTRGIDVICRYGGEEFLVLLPGSDAEQAFFHAERIRKTIAQTAMPHGEKQPLGCVSVSGGVASFPVEAANSSALVSLADEALYQAKRAGRNRVHRVKTDLVDPPLQYDPQYESGAASAVATALTQPHTQPPAQPQQTAAAPKPAPGRAFDPFKQ